MIIAHITHAGATPCASLSIQLGLEIMRVHIYEDNGRGSSSSLRSCECSILSAHIIFIRTWLLSTFPIQARAQFECLTPIYRECLFPASAHSCNKQSPRWLLCPKDQSVICPTYETPPYQAVSTAASSTGFFSSPQQILGRMLSI